MMNETTFGTPLRSIMRVHVSDYNAFFDGLIFDKGLKLGKRPAVDDGPLPFDESYSLSDMLKVLEDECIAPVGIIHDLFANTVVYVGHPASFFSAEPFQEFFRSFRAFGLERRPEFNILFSFMHYLPTGEFKSVRRICDIINSPVYTGNIAAWNGILKYATYGYMYKKAFMFFVINYFSGRGGFAVKHISLVIAYDDRNVFKPSVNRGHGRFHIFKRKRSCVEVERASIERLSSFTCGHPRYRPDDEVCGETVSVLNIVVAKLLNPEFIFSSVFGGYFKNIVACVIKSGKSVFDGIKLCIVKNKLAFDGLSKLFHSIIISKILINLNIKMEANCSTAMLKQGASAI